MAQFQECKSAKMALLSLKQGAIIDIFSLMKLKEIRKERGLTQAQAAAFLNIPVRTYKRYEAKIEPIESPKYIYMREKLNEYGRIDETHGLLSQEEIISISKPIFASFGVEFAYLFGSYAKNKAKDESDVDILVSMPLDGLKFFELAETLRESLKKKVDLLDFSQLENNMPLIREILKDGKRIYGSD